MTGTPPEGAQPRPPSSRSLRAADGRDVLPPSLPATPVRDRRARRMLLWETLLVMTVFPLTAVIAAVVDVANHFVAKGPPARHAEVVVPGSPVLTVVLGLLIELAPLGAAFLVCYLLARSGETTSAIGLDRRFPRADLAFCVVVFALGYIVAQLLLGGFLLQVSHLRGFAVDDPVKNLTLLPLFLVGALTAGPVEEIVVLGYLVRRLEQFGFKPYMVVVVGALVRISYHVYYGPGVIPIALWAVASLVLYLWIRRVWPFVLVHSLWDASLFLGQAFNGWIALAVLGGATIVGVVLAVLWWPHRLPRPLPGWGPSPPAATPPYGPPW